MRTLVATAALLSALICSAAAPPDNVIDAWFKMNALTVTISVPGNLDTVRYSFEIAPNSDFRINLKSKEAGGTLMLISGVLVSKDLPIQAGYEIDAIDGPALTMQLVNKLLAFAVGTSPDALRGHRAVDLTEKTAAIHVATSSAEGQYQAPWQLEGFVEVVTPGVITFHLTHSFKDDRGNDLTATYVGQWEHRSTPPLLPDSLSLKGWRVFDLGPIQRSSSQGTVLDYGATPSSSGYPTVGALRASVRKRTK